MSLTSFKYNIYQIHFHMKKPKHIAILEPTSVSDIFSWRSKLVCIQYTVYIHVHVSWFPLLKQINIIFRENDKFPNKS